jgi:hypothetical protein
LKRAFSAGQQSNQKPWGVSQAESEAAPLAPSTTTAKGKGQRKVLAQFDFVF